MITYRALNCNTGENITNVNFPTRHNFGQAADTIINNIKEHIMDNKKEKPANIDSAVNAKSAAENVSIPDLYAHGLEYAENLKQKEESASKNKKRGH